ncbi:hypothetical protein CONCODRAFT_20259 [Conidiobolus coronatus NRRL 28638]|uniref:F-box domain-containing protein n=1 Tax=Conidiobolus coronatus (strain ATCC 28846 / CBS 209.66 / NRRL 28638) TaxID=796925 RepID=A0A137NUN2_CONC2|nr:hypothetical protein CONCODRAFT_20259 [Conidiobolus coronatus NRRL 28638]|eukprot:KXN66381.1 hypothetical protein CONCODRAFT_20259 [Conidiobolus coronatus NRRL 28638]
MTRVLRSSTKKTQSQEGSSSKLSISNKSKAIKRRDKKAMEIKNKDSQKSDVWNINSVLTKIFSYTNHYDLLQFNTVCKKWNNLINPIIYNEIDLDRQSMYKMGVRFKRSNPAAYIDTEVAECIFNVAKHAHLVKKFNFGYKLEPQRVLELFETFKYISDLYIHSCDMSQNQFLGMINPLTQLQELTLSSLKIKKITKKGLYKEIVQLPPTLKKLRIENIKLIGNPKLFIQTINSHNNLVEFGIQSDSSQVFLEKFYKPYQSLLNFELYNTGRQTLKYLFTIFENNPQLISLKLPLEYMNGELVSHISSYLTSLEDLSLRECDRYSHDITNINFKFSQPTKIKKLNLELARFSNYPLNFILLNCPRLEELGSNRLSLNQIYYYHEQPNYVKSLNLFNYSKIKKLSIDCAVLGEGVLESLLLNCPYLNELYIKLPVEWKEVVKLIYEKCENLQKLYISPSNHMYGQERTAFFQEFYETEFITGNYKCKSTLTHLTLNRFEATDSKAEYFKSFEHLKSIKYSKQISNVVDMDLWPDYRLLKFSDCYNHGFELKRN